MRVLVAGADGFIGRHIVFDLRRHGIGVLAQARRPDRLARMGFDTLAADLTDPATHNPGFWRPHLAGVTHVIWCAGLLTASEADFAAVHEAAPRALVQALPEGTPAILVSAVGIGADTPFAHWRRRTEAIFAGAVILRPGLVLADTSYGGSSLLRALAALPVAVPVVGSGDQPFNPIHADDLARILRQCLTDPPGPGPWEVGGPEVISQAGLTLGLRAWLGLAPRPVLPVPLPLARLAGRLGDLLSLGPISRTAVAQLEQGVQTDPAPLCARLGFAPRGVSGFLSARPAGTQDLWQARLYLLKPLIRLCLAAIWLASAALGLLAPPAWFLPVLSPVLPEPFLVGMARAGGLADLALGIALLANWRPLAVGRAQLALVLAYTAGLTLIAPGLWLDPVGGLLKNLAVLPLILVHLALAEER